MKKKIIIGMALFASVIVFSLVGTNAIRTVFAAEEQISISKDLSKSGLQGDLAEEVLSVYKENIYKDQGVTVILPAGYVKSKEVQGMYVAQRHPLDSSNIYYKVTEGGDSSSVKVSLGTEDYKNAAENKFKEAYGATAKISNYKFEEIIIDGCPAYRIALTCEVDEMKMEQLIVMIIADNTYTITYSQSGDDERMADFEKSLESLHIVFN